MLKILVFCTHIGTRKMGLTMETGKAGAFCDRKMLLEKLRLDILHMQAFCTPTPGTAQVELGKLSEAFPHGVFPTAAIHEFIAKSPETAAASSAFISAITSMLAAGGGACIWIHKTRRVFPPGIKTFGLNPEQIVFVGTKGYTEALWAAEQALKSAGVAAVIAEIPELGVTASRRLQLAVEKSGVTGLVLRDNPRYLGTTAAAARWFIRPAATRLDRAGMPGLGHPSWLVSLDKVKNGRPKSGLLQWKAGRMQEVTEKVAATVYHDSHLKAG